MAPVERSSTPLSTTSEESQPPLKRRRVETAANPKTVNTMRSSAGPQNSSSEIVPEVKILRISEQQGSMLLHQNNLVASMDSQQLQSFKEPFRNIVTIVCGSPLNIRYQVDLALICAESEKQLQLFMNAEQLHDQYKAVKILRKRARAFYSLLNPRGILKMDDSREKAMDIIETVMQEFPLKEYQKSIKAKLIYVVDTFFQDHDMFLIPPAKAKKLDRSIYPIEDVGRRLALLKSVAFFAVIERMNFFMEVMKAEEPKHLAKDPLKAAAYRRILLPDTDPMVVEAILQWLHKGSLPRADTEQLLRVYTVADHLGISRLTIQCMDLLSSSVAHVIKEAKDEGVTLSVLLQQYHTSKNNGVKTEDALLTHIVIGDVFKFTLQSTNPPAALQNLVVNAIVDSEDEEIFETLLGSMNMEMRGMLAKVSMRKAKLNAMAARKTERDTPQTHPSSAAGVDRCESRQSFSYFERSPVKSETSDVKYDWNSTTGIAGSEVSRETQFDEQIHGREAD